MRWMVLPAVLTASLLAPADAKDEAVKKDMKQLQGTWSLVSLERDGVAAPLAKEAVRVITDDKYVMTLKPGVTIEGTFTIDPGAKPKGMETTPSSGPYKDKALLGIYEIDGDTLKICYALPAKPRPTEFTSKEGSGWILSVHKRVKE